MSQGAMFRKIDQIELMSVDDEDMGWLDQMEHCHPFPSEWFFK